MCRSHPKRPPGCGGPELADIFLRHAGELSGLTLEQEKAVLAILRCRTAALGGHLERCDRCGREASVYNSCWNRHCPKCQGIRQAEWLQARKADLLSVTYFHVVFTVPRELHPLFQASPRAAYGILMAAAAQTLQQVALNPKRLGARIGFMEILHTWTQQLLFHPHVHCVVPGEELSPDGTRWISSNPRFFIHVKVLSKVFRGILLRMLEEAIAEGRFGIEEAAGKESLKKASRRKWVVYCKPPFEGPENVLEYLGRYTHRIAISNSRIFAYKNGKATFRYRDRADGDRVKTRTIDAPDFLNRFLLHVLPTGFTRIRYDGFLANGAKKTQLPLCRLIRETHSVIEDPPPSSPRESWMCCSSKSSARKAAAVPTAKSASWSALTHPRGGNALSLPAKARPPANRPSLRAFSVHQAVNPAGPNCAFHRESRPRSW